MEDRIISLSRRELLRLLAAGGYAALAGLPAVQALAQGRKDTLVIGIDTSDSTEFDPVRDLHYTPPMTVSACYDALVTMTPGDYINLKPALATSWARTPDGQGWRFTLRDNVKFVSGNPMTAHDVKFSLDRVRYIQYQSSQYLTNVTSVNVVDDRTVDIMLKNPNEPLLTILAAPSFVVTDRKVVAEHGGDATPESKAKDKATEWLNQNSAGTGPYQLKQWVRNSQIQLVANPNYWGGKPPFQRIVIRHFEDGSAQLLSLRRGDIDVAFNLLPEQITSLKSDSNVWIARHISLDFVYIALSHSPELNKALANKSARQAIGWAIDYDGIRDGLLGGSATRPANFIPIGTLGSTEEIAKEIGFRQDLDKSRKALAAAGMPDGFEFEIIYGNSMIAGTSYHVIAQKIQSDLARVGIKMKLNPMPQVNVRTLYNGGKMQAVMTYWNPPAVENALWGWATVQRVAKRLNWKPTETLVKLVDQASMETDQKKQAELWRQYQIAMVDEANLIVLFQPIYQVGVRKTIKDMPLTAAGWQADLRGVKPA
ncbi:MAG: ABC transporter substrate-binding protein [Burkholderiales bacterium]